MQRRRQRNSQSREEKVGPEEAPPRSGLNVLNQPERASAYDDAYQQPQ